MSITQNEVNERFVDIKAEWDEKYKESGCSSVSLFVITDKWTGQFLAMFHELKEVIEGEGLELPILVEGLTVSIKD